MSTHPPGQARVTAVVSTSGPAITVLVALGKAARLHGRLHVARLKAMPATND
ncbi:hypothetical protein ACFTXJ_00410 [Streptomyces zhihengii]|uniref:hypothetical protein n=1 Tax=Streptomyces zhihengii TaxID=1818004 RepID=UPI00363C6C72